MKSESNHHTDTTTQYCSNVYRFFKVMYETSPVNFSSLTGISHIALPRLKGHFIYGRYRHANRDGPLETILRAADLALTHPSGACHFWLGVRNVVLLTKPSHIKQVLIYNEANLSRNKGLGDSVPKVIGNSIFFDTGATWRHKRILWKKALLTGNALKSYAPCVENLVADYTAKLQHSMDTPINLQQFFTEFTLDVIGQTLMANEDLPILAEELTTLLIRGLQAATTPSVIIQDKLSHLQKLLFCRKNPVGLAKLQHAIKRFFNDAVLSPTEETLKVTKSLLSTIYELHGGFDAQGREKDAILGDALFLIFAGHTTTAATFQFAVKLLTANPDIAQRLHDVLKHHFADQPLTTEALDNIDYLEWIIKETLRLFPALPILTRGITRSFYVANLPVKGNKKDYTVATHQWLPDSIYLARGSTVVISPYVMHHSADFFHHPEDFIPERFSPEYRDSIPSYAYMPFGIGPRACLGQRFAWQELKLLLASVYLQGFFDIEDNNMTVDPYNLTLSPLVAPVGCFRQYKDNDDELQSTLRAKR